MTVRIAFYAPLKPPGHETPSGDRRFARLLMRALRRAGFAVELASSLRSRNGDGDPARQAGIEARADRTTARLLKRFAHLPPDLWFTYHVYHKAPDLLGPAVADALAIPYVIAEGSTSPRQAAGPWARGHALAADALRRADLILQPNPKDLPGLDALTGGAVPQRDLPPFLDARAEGRAASDRNQHRATWSERLTIDPGKPWLLATAMMRPGDKQQSHAVLAAALKRLGDVHLVLVGDGPARLDVEAEFMGDRRVRFAGALPPDAIRELNAACDIFVWPAIGEAFGLAVLEALAAGLPAVLGDRPGIRAMTGNGRTAILTPEGDVDALADAVAGLLDDPNRQAALGAQAAAEVAARHDIASAADTLRSALTPLIGRPR